MILNWWEVLKDKDRGVQQKANYTYLGWAELPLVMDCIIYFDIWYITAHTYIALDGLRPGRRKGKYVQNERFREGISSNLTSPIPCHVFTSCVKLAIEKFFFFIGDNKQLVLDFKTWIYIQLDFPLMNCEQMDVKWSTSFLCW